MGAAGRAGERLEEDPLSHPAPRAQLHAHAHGGLPFTGRGGSRGSLGMEGPARQCLGLPGVKNGKCPQAVLGMQESWPDAQGGAPLPQLPCLQRGLPVRREGSRPAGGGGPPGVRAETAL